MGFFGFLKKNTLKNAAKSKAWFIVSSVDKICKDRQKAGLPVSLSYQLEYMALLLVLLEDANYLQEAEKCFVHDALCLYCAKSANENVRDIHALMSASEKYFHSVTLAYKNYTNNHIRIIVHEIEKELSDGKDSDSSYMRICDNTVIPAILAILKSSRR